MTYQSSASIQPKVYKVNLTIVDNDVDEALVAAAIVLAQQDDPSLSTRGKLQSAGKLDRYIERAVHQAVNDHFVLGS